MTDEPDTMPDEGVTDNVNPTDDDTGDDLDFYDPGDPDTSEEAEEQPTEDEGGEPEDTPDEDEAEAEPEPEPEAEPKRADATAKVTMADGTETTVGELVKGHMRQADYTAKTQDLANRRKSVEADASRIESISQAFIDHLSAMVPAEPTEALRYTDPAAYNRQLALHNASIAQVEKLIRISGEPKQITEAMSAEDQRAHYAEQNRKLIEMFPETATQQGRQVFWTEVSETAQEVGFSAEELRQVDDPRLFALAHWARKGMAAEKAKAQAKAKVAKAPPSAPVKPGQGARAPNRNAEAMRKLSRTGSIQDALLVDFE